MRIIKGIGGFYYVTEDDGKAPRGARMGAASRCYECRAKGKFRKDGIKPMIGDFVKLADNNTVIAEILERKNELVRPAVSNVDQVLIVLATENPKPDLFLVDKLILQAKLANAEPIICVNKTDLADAKAICKIYQNAGLKTLAISALEKKGLGAVGQILKNKTTVLAGNSGVGKSTILNTLGFNSETGDISKIGRGKHTTRHNELFKLCDNTFIIDTAGFSILDIANIEKNSVKNYFTEFEGYNCKFQDCLHLPNTVCEVNSAVSSGKIAKSRYDSYLKLINAIQGV